MPFEKDPNEIGVFWEKTGAKGRYLSGTVNGESVVVFPIDSKNSKAPNWRVLRSVKQGGGDARPAHNANVQPSDDPFGFGE